MTITVSPLAIFIAGSLVGGIVTIIGLLVIASSRDVT